MAGGGIGVPGWPLLVVGGARASFYEPPVAGVDRVAATAELQWYYGAVEDTAAY